MIYYEGLIPVIWATIAGYTQDLPNLSMIVIYNVDAIDYIYAIADNIDSF